MEYEWKPPFCEKCQKVWHKCEAKTQKHWRQKSKMPIEGKPIIIEDEIPSKKLAQAETWNTKRRSGTK